MRCLLILIVLLLSGCEPVDETNFEELQQKMVQEHVDRNVTIVIIDSCEYVHVFYGDMTWGSHKGNCKFCKIRNQTK